MTADGKKGSPLDNEILTLEEVASYLRLKPQTIYKWVQEKRIPAAKLGKEWRFRRSVIDRWLDDLMFNDGLFDHLREKSGVGRAVHPPHRSPQMSEPTACSSAARSTTAFVTARSSHISIRRTRKAATRACAI